MFAVLMFTVLLYFASGIAGSSSSYSSDSDPFGLSFASRPSRTRLLLDQIWHSAGMSGYCSSVDFLNLMLMHYYVNNEENLAVAELLCYMNPSFNGKTKFLSTECFFASFCQTFVQIKRSFSVFIVKRYETKFC